MTKPEPTQAETAPSVETDSASSGRSALLWIAAAFLLLWGAGRFLAGPYAWGFNHLAYLPVWFQAVWAVAALAIFLPPVRDALGRIWEAGVAHVFASWRGPLALTLILTALFWLFRERAFFMGDGYLVAELIQRGVSFRGFDAMDYLTHFKIYTWVNQFKEITAFTIYQILSVVAGALFILVTTRLAQRFPWAPWRKLFLVFLALSSGLTILFCGYVESYGYLYVWVTAYLMTSVLVLENRAPLWLASVFFGCGISSHLTGVFSILPLLYLIWRGPRGSLPRRFVEAAGPALAIFALTIVAHYVAGYNEAWFRRDFLDNRNAQRLWIPLSGYTGLFSAYHWKDLINLVLIATPMAVGITFVRARTVWAHRSDPRIQMLMLQLVVVAFFGIALDRKLGGARDWDLLTAHAGVVYLLAALVVGGALPPLGRSESSSAGRGPGSAPVLVTASLLLSIPWIGVQSAEERSIERFVSVVGDFPTFQRSYAYEEVGKYYRNNLDLERALHYYTRMVETTPNHARFRVLRGSVALARATEADIDAERRKELEDLGEADLRRALEITPDLALAQRHLARMLLTQGKYDEAIPLYKSIISKPENRPTAADVESYGIACLQGGQFPEAIDAFRRVLEVEPTATVHHPLGAAYMGVRDYPSAVGALRTAMERGSDNPAVRYGLAASIVSSVAERSMPVLALDEAESLAKGLLEARPGDREVSQVLQRIQLLRAGVFPPGGTTAPEAPAQTDSPG